MKHRVASIGLLLLAASPALAQSPASGTRGGSGSQPRNSQPSGAQSTAANPASPAQPAAPEQVDPAKEAAIRHLMELTGVGKLSDQMVDATRPQMREMIGQLIEDDARAQKFLDTFFQKFRTRFTETDLINAIVPIYARHYSLEDIQALNAFYESPLGQRVMRELPEITKESQAAGAAIGQKAAMETLQEMSADYPELKQVVTPGSAQPAPAPAPAPPRQ